MSTPEGQLLELVHNLTIAHLMQPLNESIPGHWYEFRDLQIFPSHPKARAKIDKAIKAWSEGTMWDIELAERIRSLLKYYHGARVGKAWYYYVLEALGDRGFLDQPKPKCPTA